MKICFLSSKSKKSLLLKKEMISQYGNCSVEQADYFVCLGGDGFMLHAIHNYFVYQKPFYGINCGSVGFLLNLHNQNSLFDNICQAKTFVLHPLITVFYNALGARTEHISFNEVSFMRANAMAAHLEIKINNTIVIDKLVADGILLATPAGSNAYNIACGGKPIDFSSDKLVLTSINAFSPLGRNSQIIDNTSIVEIKNISSRKFRKVNMFYDFKQKNNLSSCTITNDINKQANLLLLPKT